jgi:hypothetical protein
MCRMEIVFMRLTVGGMNNHLRNVVMSEQNEHLRVMSTEGIRDICVMKINIRISLCCLLKLDQLMDTLEIQTRVESIPRG